jgi:hypothetical protein
VNAPDGLEPQIPQDIKYTIHSWQPLPPQSKTKYLFTLQSQEEQVWVNSLLKEIMPSLNNKSLERVTPHTQIYPLAHALYQLSYDALQAGRQRFKNFQDSHFIKLFLFLVKTQTIIVVLS